MPDQTVTRDRNRCTAHTRSPWNGRHLHSWWPDGSRPWAMRSLVAVVVGVLVIAIVFAVNPMPRHLGAKSNAGASPGHDASGPVVEKGVLVAVGDSG